MNRLPHWEGPVLERKSNPGFPRCPQPELEGHAMGRGTVLLLLSVKILLQTSALLEAAWLLHEAYGGRSYKPPPLGISRKGCPTRRGGARVQVVTYVQSEPLHPSLMQSRDELQQRMHDRRLRDTNTHA